MAVASGHTIPVLPPRAGLTTPRAAAPTSPAPRRALAPRPRLHPPLMAPRWALGWCRRVLRQAPTPPFHRSRPLPLPHRRPLTVLRPPACPPIPWTSTVPQTPAAPTHPPFRSTKEVTVTTVAATTLANTCSLVIFLLPLLHSSLFLLLFSVVFVSLSCAVSATAVLLNLLVYWFLCCFCYY